MRHINSFEPFITHNLFDILAAITCDTSQLINQPDSYQDAPSSMSASQSIHGACPNSGGSVQTRFADGTTEQTLKCTVSGVRGVISGQVTSCQG